MTVEALELFRRFGQSHIVVHLEHLPPEKRAKFLTHLEGLDLRAPFLALGSRREGRLRRTDPLSPNTIKAVLRRHRVRKKQKKVHKGFKAPL